LFQLLKNYCWHLPKAFFYNLYFGFPAKKLILIGITGTDGKTTTVHLVHQALVNAGYKVSLSSTVNAPGLHTTSPDARLVQQSLSRLVKSGYTHAVIEVTAHALDQFRYFGCRFHIGLLTNTSHEHLDDFIDMDNYIATKKKLLANSRFPITNADDQSYKKIKNGLPSKLTTFALNHPADYRAKNIKTSSRYLTFKINDLSFKTNSPFNYQVYNILAAHAICQCLGIPASVLQKTIASFPEIKGRREEVKNNLGLRCLIEFAHTPQALEATLSSLRPTTKNRLIVIFGATGGRDQTKRPIMGQVVSHLADIAFITADDTRNENVSDINRQIISGIDKERSISLQPENAKDIVSTPKTKKFFYFNIPSRQEAFNLAIKIAKPGDTIVACGKGHETTILHGSTEYPWSESQAFRTAINLHQLAHAS